MQWEEPEISELWETLDHSGVESVARKWKGRTERIHHQRSQQRTGFYNYVPFSNIYTCILLISLDQAL